MRPFVKNMIIFVLAMAGGMLALTAGHMLSNLILPIPEGMNESTESFVANAHKLTTGHWILALLSHALGPLVSAYILSRFSATHHKYLIGGATLLWLILGTVNLMSIPHPGWFMVVDLITYAPAALLGVKLAGKNYFLESFIK